VLIIGPPGASSLGAPSLTFFPRARLESEARLVPQREYRDEGRILAVQATRAKAQLMAKELGLTVGRARVINEVACANPEPTNGNLHAYWGWGYSFGDRVSQGGANVRQNMSGPSQPNQGPFSPGTIAIKSCVTITFDLES
jgi:uncharacterized protein